MTHRCFVQSLVLGVASAALLGLGIPAAGQTPAGRASTKTSTATAGAKSGKVPRTVDGQPDLQGVWNFATATPLERPGEYAGKQVLTEEEASEFAEKDAATEGRGAGRERTL